MRIYLIRHGTTSSNTGDRFQGMTDNPLAEMGLKQSDYLGEYFADVDLAAIYSSPLLRARQTALGVIKHHPEMGIRIVKELHEIDGGDLEDQTTRYIAEHYPQTLELLLTKPGEAQCPNGESGLDVYERMAEAMDKIAKVHRDDQAIAVVSHGIAIMAYLAFVRDIPGVQMPRRVNHNASITCIEYSFADDRASTVASREIIFEDYVEHLPEELRYHLAHSEKK